MIDRSADGFKVQHNNMYITVGPIQVKVNRWYADFKPDIEAKNLFLKNYLQLPRKSFVLEWCYVS